MIPVCKERKTVTPSSGDGSINTLNFNGAELVQVYTKSTTATTIYDLALVDEDNDTIYEKLAITGDWEESSIYIPLLGIYTIQIIDSTVDEAIVVKLMIEE